MVQSSSHTDVFMWQLHQDPCMCSIQTLTWWNWPSLGVMQTSQRSLKRS